MDSEVSIYAKRSENELRLSRALFRLSQDDKLKDEIGVYTDDTFYSAVISHSYYSIFYAAKALLFTVKIKTSSPNVHGKTYDKFKEIFVDTGKLDVALLNIYNKLLVRADELLGLFKLEKSKRGRFTYRTVAQANVDPAKESIENANRFVSNILKIIKG